MVTSLDNELKNIEFKHYVGASYPILWVNTDEYDRCIKDLSNEIKICPAIGHSTFCWDQVSGIKNALTDEVIEPPSDDDVMQPINFIKKEDHRVIFALDYHLFIKNDVIWRTLLNAIETLKISSNIFVIVSPIVEIPPEINRYVTVIDFKLPTVEQLKVKLDDTINDIGSQEVIERFDEVITAGLGLTAYEFENALYLSMASNGGIIAPEMVHKQKEQLVRKNGSLTVDKCNMGFDTLIGMDNLKFFTKQIIVNNKNKDSFTGKGKGVLIVGVPGGGKTHFARTLGHETGRITISLDFGDMMGSLVGETERKTREALSTIDAMEPAVLFIDEIEKGLAGVSGYNGDSGTSQRQGGRFLKWLSDHESDVYVVATSNDISKLPPEYLRAGRWDAIFFVDLPNANERESIIKLYSKKFMNVELTESELNEINTITNKFTGAEIETMCKLAGSLNISMREALKYVTPLYKTMEDKIKHLQSWAVNRTVPATLNNPIKETKSVTTSDGVNNGKGRKRKALSVID